MNNEYFVGEEEKVRSSERSFFSAKRIALTAIVIPRKPPVPSGATLRAPCAEASFLRDSILSARRLSGALKNIENVFAVGCH